MILENCSIFNDLVNNIKKQKSFTMTGLTSFSRLLLLKYIREISGKKILFITSTEQLALRYNTDLERIFEMSSSIIPYQNISCYETVQNNLYDYEKQVSVLRAKPDIVIAPCKVLTEKFPNKKFFEEKTLKLSVGDSIEQRELLKKLISLGYKRATLSLQGFQ